MEPQSLNHLPFDPAGFGSNQSTNKQEILNNNTVEIHPERPIVVRTSKNETLPDVFNSTSNFVSLIPITIIPQTLHPFVPQVNITTAANVETSAAVATSAVQLCSLPCPQNSHCEIGQGTTKCVCNAGWTGDGNYCVGKCRKKG